MSNKKKTSVPVGAVTAAPAETSGAFTGSFTLVISAFPGTEKKIEALWRKALGDSVKFKVVDVVNPFDALQSAVCDDSVADNFVYVPANCFPTSQLKENELWLPVVYVKKDGSKIYEHCLPKQFNKASLIELMTDQDIDENDLEDFFKKASKAWTDCPVEVSFNFGNFVTPVLRADPCEHVVIEALIRKKYIVTSANGWKAIEHIIDKTLAE